MIKRTKKHCEKQIKKTTDAMACIKYNSKLFKHPMTCNFKQDNHPKMPKISIATDISIFNSEFCV